VLCYVDDILVICVKSFMVMATNPTYLDLLSDRNSNYSADTLTLGTIRLSLKVIYMRL